VYLPYRGRYTGKVLVIDASTKSIEGIEGIEVRYFTFGALFPVFKSGPMHDLGDWRLAIGDWRLAIGDWRLAIGLINKL
jgi:hypothetical protein